MAFRWLVAFLNNCISTKIDGPFESFRFFNQEITLVAGLEDLLKICRSLNNAGARYLVIGGFAIIQHGFTRATGKGSIPQIRMFYVDGLK
jgi:hypothetical protein